MFAQRLKELRKERNMTQIEFAKEFNISSGTIAMWETGKRTPDNEMMIKIANYFNVSLDYLMGNSNTANTENDLEEVYFSFAKKAQDEGIDPSDIELAIETIKKLKKKDR